MAGFGLRLGRSQGMEGFTGNHFEYLIDPANTNLIFTGDPVLLNAGYIEEASGNTQGNITPSAPLTGVFAGCRYVDQNGDYQYRQYWDGAAGRSDVYAYVAHPAHTFFHVRGQAGTNFNQTDVGTRFELFYNPGEVATGDSRVTLGQAAPTTGSVVLRGLADIPGNAWAADGGTETIMEVSFVLQQITAADAA